MRHLQDKYDDICQQTQPDYQQTVDMIMILDNGSPDAWYSNLFPPILTRDN